MTKVKNIISGVTYGIINNFSVKDAMHLAGIKIGQKLSESDNDVVSALGKITLGAESYIIGMKLVSAYDDAVEAIKEENQNSTTTTEEEA